MTGKMIGVLILLLMIPLGHPQSAQAAVTPMFSLTSDDTNLTPVGGNKRIDIDVDGARDLIAYEFTLEYDPMLWEFVAATTDLAGYKATPLKELQADGIVTFAFAKIGKSAGENGSVHLGHVTLKAKAPGNDRIQLAGVRLVDSRFAASNYTPDTVLASAVDAIGNGNGNDGSSGDNGSSNGNEGTGGNNGSSNGNDETSGSNSGNDGSSGSNGNDDGAVKDNSQGSPNGSGNNLGNGNSDGSNGEQNPPPRTPDSSEITADGKSGQSDEAHQQAVTEESMKPDEEGSTVVQIADGIKEILLPANTADIAGIKKLELRSGTFSLAIDSIVLKELTKLVGGGELSDAAISITIEQASQEEAVSLLAGMEEGMGTLKAAGTIYHFGLSIVTKDGAARKLAVFEQPVELALPYDNEADESTLGVYFLNENDKVWEYAGGTVDGDGKVIKVKLSHFSTYAVLEYDKAFQDLPAAHWAFNAVRTLSARHVVNGVSATQFGPGTEVSRAEFAALLSRALGLKPANPVSFVDVDDKAWYAQEIAAAYDAKLIQGRSAEVFAPNERITREEMAVMIVRAFEYGSGKVTSDTMSSFDDSGSVSLWAVKDVRTAVSSGLMNGIGGGKFAPGMFTTRAEAANVIYKLLTMTGS